jgi:hypothetical protein
MSFLRKHQSQSGDSKPPPFVDVDFQNSYPALFEFMSCPTYPDGSSRQLSTLTLFRDDNLWKACLNEKDQGLVLFVSEDRFGVLLEALELLLQEERPPWRKSTHKGKPGTSGKGKGT